MSEEVDKKVIELVEEVKQPGVFNILDAVKGKLHPKEDVNVYLNEDAAFRAAIVTERITEVQRNIDNEIDVKENTKVLAELNDVLKKAHGELNESKYVFTISGIDEGVREKCHNLSIEKYPIKYDEDKNPFTGEVKRTEIADEQRDKYFTSLLWAESISKIVAPDGSIQESVPVADIDKLRGGLPASANIMINESIERVRTASAIFLMSVDEDFLAKS